MNYYIFSLWILPNGQKISTTSQMSWNSDKSGSKWRKPVNPITRTPPKHPSGNPNLRKIKLKPLKIKNPTPSKHSFRRKIFKGIPNKIIKLSYRLSPTLKAIMLMIFEIKKIIWTPRPSYKLQLTPTLLARFTNLKGKLKKKIMNFHSLESVTPETKIEP